MTNKDFESFSQFTCSKCGCVGLHACTGSPIVWTEEDKERLKKALASIFSKDKK